MIVTPSVYHYMLVPPPLFFETVAHRSSRGGADAAARGGCGAIVAVVG